jgi:5-methyltetrahydropteroyltriglutamate--homocysteine methyltransferase
MSEGLYPTQEIGSLARPRWQTVGAREGGWDADARAEFARWDEAIGFAQDLPDARAAVLAGRGAELAPEVVRDLGALFGLRFLETVGLDRVYDGEARRIEMYEYPIRRMTGFRLEDHVRSFDSKYYRKATVVDRVGLERPLHVEEFDFVRRYARAEPKLPLTGPYTLADWSYDEYYLARQPGWKGPAARRAARREFVLDLARRAVRPTVRALVDRGCRTIQIDEPAGGTHPEETDLLVEGFNAATEGIDAEFSMHVCFSDYRALLPGLLEAKRCDQWAWEFANRDGEGSDGYEVLKSLREYPGHPSIGLGVLDVHRDAVETPAQVAERIGRAAKYLGDPARLWVNPDCGLRTRRLEVARAKLEAMVAGTRLARAELETPRR